MKNAVFIPLGDKVAEALHFLADQGMLPRDRVLMVCRIRQGIMPRWNFLGRRKMKRPVSQNQPEKIDRLRESMSVVLQI